MEDSSPLVQGIEEKGNSDLGLFVLLHGFIYMTENNGIAPKWSTSQGKGVKKRTVWTVWTRKGAL